MASSPQESPSSTSASGVVFFGIMNGLAEQKLVPGQRLVEVDLAALYKVSRNSVREALQQLAAQGVVEILRNKGAAIRSLSLQETLEVLDVAERMTGLLAKSAALGIAAGKPAAEIEEALGELRQANSQQDQQAFARAPQLVPRPAQRQRQPGTAAPVSHDSDADCLRPAPTHIATTGTHGGLPKHVQGCAAWRRASS